jgi:hypothetical protein
MVKYANEELLRGFLDEVHTICDTALFYNPENITIRQHKALTYYLQKEYETADSLYTALIADEDSTVMTFKFCGLSRFLKGNWYQAIEPLTEASKLDPTAVDVCIFLGISIGRTYNSGDAFEWFDKADSLMAPDSILSRQLIQYRAEMYCQRGNCSKGAELLYQLWVQENRQLAWLQQIQNCYFRKKDNLSDNDKQRCLFICHLQALEILNNPADSVRTGGQRILLLMLSKFEEEMTLNNLKSLPMLSPDNQKSTLSIEKLQELIRNLSKL